MKDITYCISVCPFEDCERHQINLKNVETKYVSIADLTGTCRRYIEYIVDSTTEYKNKYNEVRYEKKI